MIRVMYLTGSLLLILLVLATVTYGSLDNSRTSSESSTEQRLRLANLAGACESSSDGGGFGTFEIKRDTVIRAEEGEITVPCHIRMLPGGSLVFEDVTLQTRSITIVDDDGVDGTTSVQFLNSTLTGVGESGFFLRLTEPDDNLSIDQSTMDFPLSFWAIVRGENTGDYSGGSITVTDSKISSLDPESEGIKLITSGNGGVGTFVDLDLETVVWDPDLAPGIPYAILLAGDCQVERVTGYPLPCSRGESEDLTTGG